MTQAELAKRIGRSRSAVNSWENGRAVPQRRVAALEEVLGISLHDDDDEFDPIMPGTRAQIERDYDPDTAARIIGVLEKTLVPDPASRAEPGAAERPRSAPRQRG